MRVKLNEWYLLESLEDYLEAIEIERLAAERQDQRFNLDVLGGPPQSYPVFVAFTGDQDGWHLTYFPRYITPEVVNLMQITFEGNVCQEN